MRATLRIFTFKEGLLSRAAHDLRIRGEAQLELEGESLVVRVRLADLRSEGAMVRGRLDPSALSSADLRKIDKTMHGEVLGVRQQAEAVFSGTLSRRDDGAVHCKGTLRLAGRERAMELLARPDGDRLRGRVSIAPSRWGIKPYRALAGTLRLRDQVDIAYELDGGVLAAS